MHVMKIGEFFDKLAGAKLEAPLETNATSFQRPRRQKVTRPTHSITRVVFVAFLVGASFFIGAMYQKSQQPTIQALGSSRGGDTPPSQPLPGDFGFGGRGSYDHMYRGSLTSSQVTAISSSNLTVQDTSGNSNTYTISSNTLITENGQEVNSSSISVGDAVIIVPERNDPTTARRIIVNPSMGNTQPTTVAPGSAQLD